MSLPSDNEIVKPSKHKLYYWRHREKILKKAAERNQRQCAQDSSNKSKHKGGSSNATERRTYQDAAVQADYFGGNEMEDTSNDWHHPTIPDSEYLMSIFKDNVPPAFRSLDALDAVLAPGEFSSYDRFVSLRTDIQDWASLWGGVSAWPHTFEILFYRALARGPERVKYFINRLGGHEMKGRVLLLCSQTFHSDLPNSESPFAIPILWSYQQEQVTTLVQGLTIIQTRIPLMSKSVYAVGPGDVLNTAVAKSFSSGAKSWMEEESNDAEEEALVLDVLNMEPE